MDSGLFNSTTVPVLEQVIAFSQSRHALLAGNVANIDTPGYRVRDLSVDAFQQALKNAIEAKDKPSEPLSPGMIGVDRNEAMREVHESMKSILYHDESDVGMEQQVTELVKNQMMHNLAIDIMSSQYRLLQTAISERV